MMSVGYKALQTQRTVYKPKNTQPCKIMTYLQAWPKAVVVFVGSSNLHLLPEDKVCVDWSTFVILPNYVQCRLCNIQATSLIGCRKRVFVFDYFRCIQSVQRIDNVTKCDWMAQNKAANPYAVCSISLSVRKVLSPVNMQEIAEKQPRNRDERKFR